MGSVVPPRYVVAPAELVYADLPRTIVLTGIRIWGLGWRYRYERAGPIDEGELQELLGLRRSQLFEHLARLVATGVLRYTNIDGRLRFDFTATRVIRSGRQVAREVDEGRSASVDATKDEGLAGGRGIKAIASPENRTQSTIHDVVVGSDSELRQQQQQVLGALDRIGVAEPTRGELAGLEWATVGYMEAWAQWYVGQGELGVGWVVEQVRAGRDPPEVVRAAMGRMAGWLRQPGVIT